MTVGVDAELRIREYPGDDSATPRAYGFRILDEDDLRLTRTNADGSETVLVRGTDYTVSGAGNPTGGNVTPLAPIATGTSWRIEGDMSLGQPTDYTAGDDFPAESHERGLDRSMIAHQEARRDINDTQARALMFPRGEVAGQLPPAADRGGKLLSFAAVTGQPLLVTGGGSDPALRTDMADPAAGSLLMAYRSAAAAAVARNLSAKLDESVSLRDFGAAGDGAADDSAALQAAIDSGAGAIFVPRGVYIVDAVEGTGIHLYGSGTIRKKAGTKGAMLSLFGANRIEGVTIDYDWENADQTPPNFGNAAVEQVQGSLDLAGVKFIRSFDSAVYVVGASLNIDGACSFTGGKPHNDLTGGDERPTYYVFCIADADTDNQVISIGAAYFEGASLDPEDLHLGPSGIFITASGVDGYRFRAINISNPTLLGCSLNAGNGNVTGAIDLYNGADNIVISGATIRHFTYAGIKVQNSSYFSITGNTLTDGYVPAGADTPHANGIVTIEKARGSMVEQKFGVITGNIIEGCVYSGITNSCDHVAITGNVINGVAEVAGIATGINNAANHVAIIGNVGTDVMGVQILTDGDHVKVIGNEISSGAGAADTALRFTGIDIAIEANSFISGVTAGSTGIRTNGPASHIRIIGNYIDGYPYGIDIRTTGGAVDKIVQGTNQIINHTLGQYNLGGAVTGATMVSTAAWV